MSLPLIIFHRQKEQQWVEKLQEIAKTEEISRFENLQDIAKMEQISWFAHFTDFDITEITLVQIKDFASTDWIMKLSFLICVSVFSLNCASLDFFRFDLSLGSVDTWIFSGDKLIEIKSK